MYAVLIWFPNASPSLVQKLQTIQNSALRIATGCVEMASIDHLHNKTEILPIQDHLARALQPTNPSHSAITSPSGSKDMKQTLQSRFLHCVALHLSSSILPPTDYGITINSLPTRAVTTSKTLLSHNRVLQTASPQIALVRAWRRSSYRACLSSTSRLFLLLLLLPLSPLLLTDNRVRGKYHHHHLPDIRHGPKREVVSY